MAVDLTKLLFSTDVNYMKRKPDLEGNVLLTLPGAGASVSTPISHDFGNVPFFHIGADTNNDGIIWANDFVDEFTETSLTGYEASKPSPELFYWCTTTVLTIGLINHPGATGTRRVYWAIYFDYAI